MMVGALILLAAAIFDAAYDLPRGVYYVTFFAGYIFLAYGFLLAMNARREAEDKTKK